MQHPINIASSLSGDEREGEAASQQMEPNVGTTPRGESLRSRVNQPLVQRYFMEYKSLM